jgi:ribosomal protein S18 acetylase RimI-like enzyme
LITYRAFTNRDVRILAEIWRSRAHERGLMQPMSAALFEELVLSKSYFDNAGLILALDDGAPAGYVHAGFGPTEDGSTLCYNRGVISMLIVRPEYRRRGIGQQLLAHAEKYLCGRGVKEIYGGGIHPVTPFYLGLYGGSELPGVLASDADALRRYEASGFTAVDRCAVFHRDLTTFRPIVDRKQLQLRRQQNLQVVVDPPCRTWWEACTFGGFDRTRFELAPKTGGPPIASLTVWSMEPLSTSLGVRATGMYDLYVDPAHRRQGTAVCLLGEACKQLAAEGVALLETQAMLRDTPAVNLFKKLGFKQVDEGVVFRKTPHCELPAEASTVANAEVAQSAPGNPS